VVIGFGQGTSGIVIGRELDEVVGDLKEDGDRNIKVAMGLEVYQF
jgi:hypothetical protein